MSENGETASDDFTLFLLQVYRELKISNPKIHVRYNDKLRERIESTLKEINNKIKKINIKKPKNIVLNLEDFNLFCYV